MAMMTWWNWNFFRACLSFFLNTKTLAEDNAALPKIYYNILDGVMRLQKKSLMTKDYHRTILNPKKLFDLSILLNEDSTIK